MADSHITTNSEDTWTPSRASRMANDEFMYKLSKYAKDHNLALASMPVCPQCQVWGKVLGSLYVVKGRIVLDGNELSGILLIMCDDCVKEVNLEQVVEDLKLWVKSGFAMVHYVLES